MGGGSKVHEASQARVFGKMIRKLKWFSWYYVGGVLLMARTHGCHVLDRLNTETCPHPICINVQMEILEEESPWLGSDTCSVNGYPCGGVLDCMDCHGMVASLISSLLVAGHGLKFFMVEMCKLNFMLESFFRYVRNEGLWMIIYSELLLFFCSRFLMELSCYGYGDMTLLREFELDSLTWCSAHSFWAMGSVVIFEKATFFKLTNGNESQPVHHTHIQVAQDNHTSKNASRLKSIHQQVPINNSPAFIIPNLSILRISRVAKIVMLGCYGAKRAG